MGVQTMKQSYASAGKAPRRRVHSCMGLSLSMVNTIFSCLVCPFFCSTRAASILPPRPHIGRRRRAQRGSRTALLQRRRRLVLDQRENGGKLPVSGGLPRDDPRGAVHLPRSIALTSLVFG